MNKHRRCGCPEQYKGRDCPACRGTGVIPPVTWEEYQALLSEITQTHELLMRAMKQNEKFTKTVLEQQGLIDGFSNACKKLMSLHDDGIKIATKLLAEKVVDEVTILAFKKRLENFSSGTGSN